MPALRALLQILAVQGLACRLLSAKVVIAERKRLLQAQRKCAAWCLPDALVTGVQPAGAATESGPSQAWRPSRHSASIWAVLI